MTKPTYKLNLPRSLRNGRNGRPTRPSMSTSQVKHLKSQVKHQIIRLPGNSHFSHFLIEFFSQHFIVKSHPFWGIRWKNFTPISKPTMPPVESSKPTNPHRLWPPDRYIQIQCTSPKTCATMPQSMPPQKRSDRQIRQKGNGQDEQKQKDLCNVYTHI